MISADKHQGMVKDQVTFEGEGNREICYNILQYNVLQWHETINVALMEVGSNKTETFECKSFLTVPEGTLCTKLAKNSLIHSTMVKLLRS